MLCLGAAFLATSTPLQGRQAQPPPAGAAAAQAPAAGGASATAAPQIPAAPPVRPPAINRVNELMPSWLRVRGEFRERMEGCDGLYNAGGALLARVAAGGAARHVGHEIDVQATRALTPQLQVAAGYAHIFTGAFLEQATPGASYSHPYVMATYVFLAEK